MGKYEEFIARKSKSIVCVGLEKIPDLNPMLFPFQRDIVSWALKRGRAAVWVDCGLGKSAIALEWARHIPGRVLILTPLAVAPQFVREAQKFGVPDVVYARHQDESDAKIIVTNYDMAEHFDQSEFDGVVADESSCLKHQSSKTRQFLIDAFRETPYRLCETATPSPNDYMELGGHAEFLGICSHAEMLSTYFVHDGGETSQWRLKGHAEQDFWKWLCSWAIMMKKPSDLSYSNEGFDLPPITYHEHIVRADKKLDGYLFAMPASTLQERLGARRDTIVERVAKCAEIVNATDSQFLVWCHLNAESEALAKAIPRATEISGSDSREKKEQAIADFQAGKIAVLISKSSIFGFGLNLQCAWNAAFVGLNDSFESLYQTVRRIYRFGQKQPVNIHLIASDIEGAVVSNIKRKEAEAERMSKEILTHMVDLNAEALKGATMRMKLEYTKKAPEYGDDWTCYHGDCVEVAQSLPDRSVGYSVYSPPFESLYVYSASDRDMGNSRDSEQFWEHYKFLVREMRRILKPGRLISVHCMDLPTSKQMHGYIGLRDFPGEIIRAHQEVGFIYHSRVCIRKDPVTAMQRTKALGLLHKQIRKDSAMSRQGIADYIVTFRHPEENEEPISHTAEEYPVSLWQNVAEPVWIDINPSETLQYRSAREHNDERHIAPLQLEVIRRCLNLWTNPDDVVFSPFTGIGSEGYCSLQAGRKFLGIELKESYFRQACRNLANAKSDQGLLFCEGE